MVAIKFDQKNKIKERILDFVYYISLNNAVTLGDLFTRSDKSVNPANIVLETSGNFDNNLEKSSMVLFKIAIRITTSIFFIMLEASFNPIKTVLFNLRYRIALCYNLHIIIIVLRGSGSGSGSCSGSVKIWYYEVLLSNIIDPLFLFGLYSILFYSSQFPVTAYSFQFPVSSLK
ncbi:hypothetical protein F4703DRAFT_1791872 [Phycomyces blakesleeanus]|uniref:Uncharacterized protein n=1 Tax=Phycomyces blakesleeanus (strain ATCC 8743b / DSM 1359 / FGSC 10004 / NBRC 33097 / NRRL 1555) TaxID=763407 RepID=A0A162UM52_PHYB8|nr:hypothetical protein PHYBLDRAFT_59807 [Phycomyces blakesleeanus NRRL 1555(-)]OAD76273.1 hypothetical protein PHYBLDRAFT_59807 [Phycomyces blakesleeanus NRRL 1555(-)]|eukprot:XP_018294313.1 hypothetical protein PHYBLDRAFT_59807 [Phycomyces blakesleeanus NRRL 1555(-)]